MDAARPRNTMAGGRVSGADRNATVRRRRALIFTGALAAVVDAVLWALQPETFAQLPAAYWLMAVLAIVVDARPYVVANRRASSVILPSICFTFAIVLAWGFGPALAVQLLAVTVAGVRMQHSARRTLNLAVQHAVALGAAAGADRAARSGWPPVATTAQAVVRPPQLLRRFAAPAFLCRSCAMLRMPRKRT